jgi:hypothetical protein
VLAPWRSGRPGDRPTPQNRTLHACFGTRENVQPATHLTFKQCCHLIPGSCTLNVLVSLTPPRPSALPHITYPFDISQKLMAAFFVALPVSITNPYSVSLDALLPSRRSQHREHLHAIHYAKRHAQTLYPLVL